MYTHHYHQFPRDKWMHRINYKIYPLLGILILLISLPIMVLMGQKGFQFILGAQTQDVQFSFSPGVATIDSMSVIKLLANAQTNKVGFIDITVNFDKSKVNLDSEITTTSKLGTIVKKTSKADANTLGQIRLVLALKPEDKASPATGLFEVAQLNLRRIGTGTTNLTFAETTAQVVNNTGQNLSTEFVNSVLTLGSPSTPPSSTPIPTEPPVISGNLLKNASFETDPTVDYYSLTDGSAELYQSNAFRTGSKSLKIVSTVRDQALHRWLSKNGSIVVRPGITYEGKVWIRPNEAPYGGMLTVNFWGPGVTDYISGSTSSSVSGTSSEWKQVSVKVTAPQNAKYARFEMRLVGLGTVYFDDATLVAVSGPTQTSIATPTPAPTLAPSPTPGKITKTLYPIADTYANSDSSATNYGKALTLEVDGSPKKIAYLKFDLTTISSSVLSAKINIKVKDSSGATSGGTFYIKTLNSAWNETEVTWNSRPPTVSNINSFIPSRQGMLISTDITNYIKENIGKVVAIGIETSSTDGGDFYSRESTNKPSLVIEVIQ